MTRIVFPFVLILAISDVNAQLKEFSWLLGKWKIRDKENFEEWMHTDSGSLLGVGYRVKLQDTVETERVKLVYKAGGFVYIADVAGDQPPIDFRISEHDRNGFTAENPAHDFPTKIVYKLSRQPESEDLLTVTISGDSKSMVFRFQRVK